MESMKGVKIWLVISIMNMAKLKFKKGEIFMYISETTENVRKLIEEIETKDY